MVYVKLRSFLNDVFKTRGDHILEDAMSRGGIVDIDSADDIHKKNFADYILKNYMNYSPQRNKFIYEKLLEILEIGGMFDIGDYQKTVKITKSDENIILSSLVVYEQKVRQGFAKYEVILNLFWLKGVEAEIKGINKKFVAKIIKKSLNSVKQNLNNAFDELIVDLDLSKYIRKKGPILLKLKIFDEPEYRTSLKVPDEKTGFLIEKVHAFKKNLDNASVRLKELFLNTLEEDVRLKSSGHDDSSVIEKIKTEILNEWKAQHRLYNETYKEIKKRFT